MKTRENDKAMLIRRRLLQAAGWGSLGAMLPMLGCGGGTAEDGGVSFAQGGSTRTTGTSTTALTSSGPSGHVVVVGGGMAGAAVAKYLRLWGGSGVSVTLVERSASYTSNIMSNLVLTGQRTLASLQYKYDTLVSRYGVSRIQGEVVAIDPVGRKVTLASDKARSELAYDRLVLAPGVEFIYEQGVGIPGLESAAAQAKVLHAWQAGPQTTALRNQITAMPSGGVFVLTIPAKPYRCPPGPYERACLVADWLKKNRPGSKVIILDANPGITAEVHSFTDAFMNVHAGVTEYHPGVKINGIDTSTMTVDTNIGRIKANVINAIPPHRAGRVVTAAGLADQGGRWASVNQLSYESKVAPGIHVIGDAAGTAQPKAGHIGNQLGKVCADAMLRTFGGLPLDPAPVTNSACYSPITMETASWLTAVFAYDPGTQAMAPVADSFREAAARDGGNFSNMSKWFNALMSETFS
jgi:NADPH-dependent 2,4-dienoyl-CoA reductase/sulfur reductase-like enzyme